MGGGKGLNLFKSKMAFWGDTFDFVNNQWLDKSGNNNHLLLRGASARTGNGSNLDYTISGLLTSDTIEVVSGSNTPTIPANGTLRIGPSQVVYGVTIRRSGAVWAVIPFCEPKINENMPTISYDVSGNGHHATCATLADGNITTQNNFFYLQRYGYSLRAGNILGWDTTSWTGSKDNYTAVFSGLQISGTQSSASYLQPTPDGLGCRWTHSPGTQIQLAKTAILTSGKRYRLSMDFSIVSSNNPFPGMMANVLGLNNTNKRWFTGTGFIDLDGVATGSNLLTQVSNTGATAAFDFWNPKCYLMVVVPARMTGNLDAVGNPIEFVPDGSTWLNYACSLAAPSALYTADQKGYWSDYINQGYCISGKTYLIEKTETNHFGSGKAVYDEFVANGTEALNDNNEVRELILHGTQRGFFFDDNQTEHPRTFSEMKNIKTHFMYCDREKNERYFFFNHEVSGLYPLNMYDVTNVPGWKDYQDTNKITNLVILKPGIYLTDTQKMSFNSLFKRIEEPTFGMISFVYDGLSESTYQNCAAVFNNRNIRFTRAVYKDDNLTQAHTESLLANFHEICAHTPTYLGVALSSYRGFHDDEENYNAAQLQQYYADIVAWCTSHGYNSEVRIFPGGESSILSQTYGLNYFKMMFRAAGSDKVNTCPICKYQNMGRYGNEFTDSSYVTAAEAAIDACATNKGFICFYSHDYMHNGSTLTNQGIVFDYAIAKGGSVRFYKLKDVYKILKKLK